MEEKYKKIFFVSCGIFLFSIIVSLFYVFSSDNYLKVKTGAYYCNVEIIGKDNKQTYTWDLAIGKDKIKTDVVENEKNYDYLNKFRNAVSDISCEKYKLFFKIAYSILLVIALVCVEKSSISKVNIKRKKQLEMIISIFFIIALVEVSKSYVDFNQYLKNATYYFNVV